MKVEILNESDAARMAEWNRKARNCPEVARWLTTEGYIPARLVAADDWASLTLMDDAGMCVTRVHFERDNPAGILANISLWCLPAPADIEPSPTRPGQKIRREKVVAAHILALRGVLRSSGVRAVAARALGTNDPSILLCQRIFGGAWGIEPRGGWDMGIGCAVDVHHFRMPWVLR